MVIRRIKTGRIADRIEQAYIHINRNIRPDVLAAFEKAIEREPSDIGRQILRQYIENDRLASERSIPCCQDTGLATAFVQLGNDVELEDGSIEEAVNEGIRRAQRNGPLRASVVQHPLDRRNTGDNTPAVIHIELAPDDRLVIDLIAKGGGAENTSRVYMLSPGDGREGVIRSVLQTVDAAGANPCPPVVVGVGLGGSMETAALLGKKALLRRLDEPAKKPIDAELEAELLDKINQLGIGPQGLGGRTTALGVLVESMPCHIASLPLGVNIMCHSYRHTRIEI